MNISPDEKLTYKRGSNGAALRVLKAAITIARGMYLLENRNATKTNDQLKC